MSRAAIEAINRARYDNVEGGIKDLYVSGGYDLALRGRYKSLVREFFTDTAGQFVLNLGADASGIFGTLCDIGNRGISLDIAGNKLLGNKQVRGEADYVNARAQELPFADDSISGILALDILEHLIADDSVRMLEESNRVLVPGRRIVLSTSNIDCLARRINRIIRPKHMKSCEDHANEISFTDLQSLFQSAGFADIKSYGVSVVPGLNRIQKFVPFQPIFTLDQIAAKNLPAISAEVVVTALKPIK